MTRGCGTCWSTALADLANEIKPSISSLVIYTQRYSFAGTLSDKWMLPATPHPVEQHASEDGEKAETSGKSTVPSRNLAGTLSQNIDRICRGFKTREHSNY
ncbi:hypothetical protein RB195_007797 [Necator americanus]|uniref:Peptidase C1A papain C-terminal domain-containing protein n=1 Tax=Necator americanus TaxID=51031 RepID=A0ABR1BZ06_NECAM